MKVLPKKQHRVFNKMGPAPVFARDFIGGISYKYFHIDDRSYFVFMDHVDNISLSLNEIPKLHKDGAGGFLTAFVVTDAGEISKYSIVDTRECKGDIKLSQFNTDRMTPINENQFIIEFYKKKKEDVMIKVTLD